MLNRIGFGAPFLFDYKNSLHLLRLHLLELQFAQIKNSSTNPLDVTLPTLVRQ